MDVRVLQLKREWSRWPMMKNDTDVREDYESRIPQNVMLCYWCNWPCSETKLMDVNMLWSNGVSLGWIGQNDENKSHKANALKQQEDKQMANPTPTRFKNHTMRMHVTKLIGVTHVICWWCHTICIHHMRKKQCLKMSRMKWMQMQTACKMHPILGR